MNVLRIIIFFALVRSVTTFGQGDFTPVNPTGLPYTVIIISISLNNSVCPANTVVGIFDDSLCVGTGLWNGTGNLQVVTWQGDPSQQLPGFTPGNLMLAKLSVPLNGTTYMVDAQLQFQQGNGQFGDGTFSVLSLQAWDPILNSTLVVQDPIQIYPNPCHGQLFIDHPNRPIRLIILRDLTGRIVSDRYRPGTDSNNTKLDLGSLGLGTNETFILTLNFDDQSISKIIYFIK